MGNQLSPVVRTEWKRLSGTAAVKAGAGVLHGWYVNTATTGIVTLSDALGNILVIPSGAAAGSYVADVDLGFQGTLTATFAAAGDITFGVR